MLADVGVADVGQVRHLGARADGGVLGLDEGADLALDAQLRAGPQIAERSDRRPLADHRQLAMGTDHGGAVADLHRGQRGVRANGAVRADLGRPQQLGAGMDDGVPSDRDVDVDPGGHRVDDGDAGPLVGGDDAAVEFAGQVRQLDPVVDAGHQGVVVDVLGVHGLAVGPHDRDDVGQVQLVLGVVRRQPAQRGAQRADVEGVDARVDLADGPLLRGGVGLLDDRDDLAVLRAQDPAVARRVRQRRGQHGHRGRLTAVRLDQGGQRVGVQQRDVAGGHHDDAGEIVRQRGQPAQCGVPGAQLLLLHGQLDGPAQLLGQLTDHRADAFAVLAEHHDKVGGRDLRDGMQGVRDHAASAEAVQHLGNVGAHPGAGARGQYQDRRLAVCGHRTSPVCGFVRATPFTPYETAQSRSVARQELALRGLSPAKNSLRRQDSNLNYLNQNQRCCRLHHDGLAEMSA